MSGICRVEGREQADLRRANMERKGAVTLNPKPSTEPVLQEVLCSDRSSQVIRARQPQVLILLNLH